MRPGLKKKKAKILNRLEGATGDQRARLQNRLNNVNERIIANKTQRIQNAGDLQKAEFASADYLADRNIALNNPTQINPFGQQEVTYDANGNPVVTQTLSDAQAGLLQSGQGLSQAGLDMAFGALQGSGLGQAFNPQLADRTTTGDLNADRARIEDEVFGRLTRDLDQQYGNAMQAKEQELYNKGIPFSPDPNSRYQQELNAINRRFDDQRADARAQAVQLGGQEFERSFGIGEQLRANQFAEQAGMNNQNLSQIGALQGFGTGLMLPNFQAFQGYNYNPATPFQTYGAMQGFDLQRQQMGNQMAIANMASRASGTPESSGPPIGSGAPPGL